MKIHHVKLNVEYYEYVEKRIKNAEVRFNDRGYEALDWIVLEEWTGTDYTGHAIVRRISGVFPLDKMGLKDWVLLCLE